MGQAVSMTNPDEALQGQMDRSAAEQQTEQKNIKEGVTEGGAEKAEQLEGEIQRKKPATDN